FGALQCTERIDRRGWIFKRVSIREDEGNGLAGFNRELTDRFKVFPVKCDRGSQDQTLRTGNRADRGLVESIDPWHGPSVVETRRKLGLKSDAPRLADHNPHEIGAVRGRHEIDNRCATGLGLEFGFEDEGSETIAARRAERRMLWSNEPPAVAIRSAIAFSLAGSRRASIAVLMRLLEPRLCGLAVLGALLRRKLGT